MHSLRRNGYWVCDEWGACVDPSSELITYNSTPLDIDKHIPVCLSYNTNVGTYYRIIHVHTHILACVSRTCTYAYLYEMSISEYVRIHRSKGGTTSQQQLKMLFRVRRSNPDPILQPSPQQLLLPIKKSY